MSLPDDTNLAWSDPTLQHAVEALASGNLAPAYDALAGSAGDPDRRELYAEVLGEVGLKYLAELRVERDRAPNDRHWWLLSGSALASAAWAARGTATIDDTSDDQVRGLFNLSRHARTVLRKAAKLAPDDSAPWTILQSIAKAAPDHPGEPHEVWARIRELAPDSFEGNHQRLSVLCRKWYGSTEQMMAFMRERCASLPDGHPLWSLAPMAYIEIWVDARMVGNLATRVYRALTAGALKQRAARTEVDAASDRMLADTATYADHPYMLVAQQIFGAYYDRAGVRDRARRHLERGGERASSWGWGYFIDDQQVALTKARKTVGL